MNTDTSTSKHSGNIRETVATVLTTFAAMAGLLMPTIASAQASERKPYEMPRTQVVPIQESGTDRQYELYVKLPRDYEKNTDTRYRVIYTTDAVVHMDMLSGATEFLMPDVILVGISYQKNHALADERANASRFRDYSVEEFDNPEIQARFQGGQADNHLSFIRDQIIPHIEENYRTDPAERTYFGYSLGGAFGGHIVLSEPETFKNYVLGSPSFGRNNSRVDYFKSLEASTAGGQQPTEINVLLTIGGLEESTRKATEDFMSVLQQRSPFGLALTGLEIIEDLDHAGAFPETAIRGVKWLKKIQNPDAPEVSAANTGMSLRDISPLENAFIDTVPAKRNDGISVGELGIDGGTKNEIVKLAREIAEGKHGRYDSLLVAHKDRLVFESYFLRGRINHAHPQASATKAYTSLILGRAIQLGYLTMADLDKPIIHFLDELDHSKLVEGAEKITLHKALTMHGGISIDSDNWEELEKNPGPLQGQGLVQNLLEQSEPITEESQTYLYGNFNPMLVMTVIDAVVPGTAKDFIKNEVLNKLGITNYSWDTHVSGLPQAGWMVSMTSRDMLKWGSVVLNEGKWNGEQLVSADYLAKATSGLVKPTEDWMPDTYRYGYFFYQTPVEVGDKSYDATFAWGGGGQHIIIVDELDLTIVITGHDRDNKIMAQITNSVLPAFAE